MLELVILAFLGGWLALALRSCRRCGGGCPGCTRNCKDRSRTKNNKGRSPK